MRFGRDELIARHGKLQEKIGMQTSVPAMLRVPAQARGDRRSDRYGLPCHAVASRAKIRLAATPDTLEKFRLAYDRPDVKYALICKGDTARKSGSICRPPTGRAQPAAPGPSFTAFHTLMQAILAKNAGEPLNKPCHG